MTLYEKNFAKQDSNLSFRVTHPDDVTIGHHRLTVNREKSRTLSNYDSIILLCICDNIILIFIHL